MTKAEFIKAYVEPAMHELFVRYMTGTTDPEDQRLLAALGYGPRFDGFREPTRLQSPDQVPDTDDTA